MPMKFWQFLNAQPRLITRDNDGGDPGDGGGDPGDGGGDPNDGGGDDQNQNKGGDEKRFTQEDVNRIVVKRNKAANEQLQKLEKQYEKLLENKNLTEQQRDELAQNLESVQSQLRTKEQQAAYEAKKRKEEYEKELGNTKQQAEYYKNLYESSTIEREITQAATKHEGYNPQQFIALLGTKTKMVEETDESGEKTGRLVPRVESKVKGEDGAPTTVLKTVDEAVADMKEQPELFGNLFRNNVAKGIGQGSSPDVANPTRVDVARMSDEEYFANRDAIKKQYGIRDKRGV